MIIEIRHSCIVTGSAMLFGPRRSAVGATEFRDRPIRPGTVAIGEVGLLGELRAVGGLERRLREAARLGFTRAIVPRAGGREPVVVPGVEVVTTGSLADAIKLALTDGVPGHGAGRG